MTVEQVLKSARALSRKEKVELLRVLQAEIADAAGSDRPRPDSLLQAFSDFADDLAAAGIEMPEDGAAQHDHYIYGTPKS